MAENTSERFIRIPVPMIKRLRRFLHDYPNINEILRKERFSDTFLADMIMDAVVEYNGVEPAGMPGEPGYPALSFDLDMEKIVELKPIYKKWIQVKLQLVLDCAVPVSFLSCLLLKATK